MEHNDNWEHYLQAEIPIPMGTIAMQRMLRHEYFYLIGLGVLGFLMMFGDILWRLDGIEVINDLMGMTQTQFMWIFGILWVIGFGTVFWLTELHYVKRHISDGVYQPEPKLKMTKGTLAKAIAAAVLDKYSYIIWAFTVMPIHSLIASLCFPKPMQFVVQCIVHLVWVIFIFILLGRRRIKDRIYNEELQARRKQKKHKKDKE